MIKGAVKIKFAKIKFNDIANAPGISVSFFTQGCPHRCQGCFNPETWDFNGGQEFTQEVLDNLILKINENNIERNFCILGGEPLCDENLFLTYLLVNKVKETYPNIKIFIWTGYTYEQLKKRNN